MSTAPPIVRLGLVGCGRLAEHGYAPAIRGLDGVELAAVADPRAERRELLGALAAGTPASHRGAGELAAAGGLDAVVVASPPGEHLADAAALAAAAIPCMVEKPPAPGLEAARRLAELDPPPWIGFNRRFQHGAAIAGSVPPEGPIQLDLELRYRRASWRAVSVGDEALLDLGPHLVDLALLLSGVEEASVRSARRSHERAELVLETVRGRATIHCATDRAHRERVAVSRPGEHPLATSVAGGPLAGLSGRLPGREHPLVVSLRAQLGAFAGAVRGGEPGLLATASEGARVMGVIEAARRVAG